MSCFMQFAVTNGSESSSAPDCATQLRAQKLCILWALPLRHCDTAILLATSIRCQPSQGDQPSRGECNGGGGWDPLVQDCFVGL